jgi:hypothetical protein
MNSAPDQRLVLREAGLADAAGDPPITPPVGLRADQRP